MIQGLDLFGNKGRCLLRNWACRQEAESLNLALTLRRESILALAVPPPPEHAMSPCADQKLLHPWAIACRLRVARWLSAAQRLPTSSWSEQDMESVLSRAYMWRASFNDARSHLTQL